MTYDGLLKMRLHEMRDIGNGGAVRRVPGGWVYSQFSAVNSGAAPHTVFVPIEHDSDLIVGVDK